MKKFTNSALRVICSILFLQCVSIAWAQVPLNVKGGINVMNLQPNPDGYEGEARMGFELGVSTRVGLGSFYLQPEVSFNRRGVLLQATSVPLRSYQSAFATLDTDTQVLFATLAADPANNPDIAGLLTLISDPTADPNQLVPINSAEAELRLNTLNIPLLVGRKFGKFHALFGPEFSFLLSETADLESTLTFVNEAIPPLDIAFEGTVNDDLFELNSFLFGWQAGFGIDLNKLAIDLRYAGTLTDFRKIDNGYRPQTISLVGTYKLF